MPLTDALNPCAGGRLEFFEVFLGGLGLDLCNASHSFTIKASLSASLICLRSGSCLRSLSSFICLLYLLFISCHLPLVEQLPARIGQWLGKRDWSWIWLATLVSIGLAVTFMLVTGIFLLIFSRQIIGLYLNLDDPVNAEAISVAVSIVSIAALGQITRRIAANAIWCSYRAARYWCSNAARNCILFRSWLNNELSTRFSAGLGWYGCVDRFLYWLGSRSDRVFLALLEDYVEEGSLR